jgi:hypothetical protein
MPKTSPRRLAQRSYEAFAAGDRNFLSSILLRILLSQVRSMWGWIALDTSPDAGPELARVKSSIFCGSSNTTMKSL